MSAQIKQETFSDVCVRSSDALYSVDDGTVLNVQVKQEKELIIVEQQEHQSCTTPMVDEQDLDDQTQYSDYECGGYSIKFLDHDDNVGDDRQDLDLANKYNVDLGDESDDYDCKYTDDMELDESNGQKSDDEADYKYRRFTESYKKIVDLQNYNYIFILCPVCGQSTKTFSGWTRHLYSKHSDFFDELKKTHYGEMFNGRAICNHCSQMVISNVNHYLHYFTHHCPNKNPVFQCAICEHRVLTPREIVKHLDDKHDQFNDLYRKCPLCGEVFMERKHMRYHFWERHHNEFMEKFNYVCHLCKHPRFSKEVHLFDHLIKIHHLCGHDWETRHFKADADELKYECLICHTTCHVTAPHTLLKHHLQHEDNCWWYCKFCLEKFKFSETMHLCNKMYKNYLPQASTSRGGRSKKVVTQEGQTEADWKEFEGYIIHCCPYCNEEFEKFQEWQTHMRQQHYTNTLKGLQMSLVENDIRKLRCAVCKDLIETSFIEVYTHCFQHLPHKPYKCRHCLVLMDNYQIALKHCLNKCKESKQPLYSKEDLMFRHKLANDASNSIVMVCFECKGMQFSTPDEIETHFRTQHKNFEDHFERNKNATRMVCNICKSVVKSVSSGASLKHYVEHLGEGPYKCVFCQRSYVTYERCRVHVNRYHNSHVSLKPTTTTPKEKPRPKQPPKHHVPTGLGVAREKANILNEFSEFMSYACPECDEPFSTFISWSDHIKTHHTFFDEINLSVFDSACGKNKCRECKISLCTSVSQRQKHKLTHMPNKAFVCTLCNTRTTTSGLLYSHLRRIHFSEGAYECPVCSINLNNAYERSVHVRKTHPRSEWPENMCLVCYRNYYDLRTHMFTHDTDRPKYICPVCNVAIIYFKDLQVHMKKKHNQIVDDTFKIERCRPSDNVEPSASEGETRKSKQDDENQKSLSDNTRLGKRKSSAATEELNTSDKKSIATVK